MPPNPDLDARAHQEPRRHRATTSVKRVFGGSYELAGDLRGRFEVPHRWALWYLPVAAMALWAYIAQNAPPESRIRVAKSPVMITGFVVAVIGGWYLAGRISTLRLVTGRGRSELRAASRNRVFGGGRFVLTRDGEPLPAVLRLGDRESWILDENGLEVVHVVVTSVRDKGMDAVEFVVGSLLGELLRAAGKTERTLRLVATVHDTDMAVLFQRPVGVTDGYLAILASHHDAELTALTTLAVLSLLASMDRLVL